MEGNNITVDKAVQTIKGAILRAQAQASQSSNAIQLSLYYGIGRYVSINLQQAHWGAKALDTISDRLQRELPGLRGFSSGNLKKMRIFYEEWQCLSIGSPMANQLQQLENKIEEGVEIGEKTLLCINRPIELADLRIEDFVGISFTHHMEILHKTTTLDERIYYIHQVNLHHWNKYVLRKYLSDDLCHHQGNMPNNFPKTIPDIKQSMKTISMFKDEYLLDFINTEKNLKAYWVVNVTKYHQKLKKHENVRLDEKKEKPCYTQIRIQKSGYWISGSYITSGCNVG